MKKIILLCSIIASCLSVTAQVKIGDNPTTISPSSVLEIESSNKGLLLPRVALTGTANIAPLTAHVAGMTVYNTATAGDVTPGYYYNDGAKWVRIADAAANTNIYNSNGTLQSNRVISSNGKSLQIAGAGAGAAESSAAFEIADTAKGILFPRMTSAQRDLIAAPATGLQIYNTTTNSFWYFNGTAWVETTNINNNIWKNKSSSSNEVVLTSPDLDSVFFNRGGIKVKGINSPDVSTDAANLFGDNSRINEFYRHSSSQSTFNNLLSSTVYVDAAETGNRALGAVAGLLRVDPNHTTSLSQLYTIRGEVIHNGSGIVNNLAAGRFVTRMNNASRANFLRSVNVQTNLGSTGGITNLNGVFNELFVGSAQTGNISGIGVYGNNISVSGPANIGGVTGYSNYATFAGSGAITNYYPFDANSIFNTSTTNITNFAQFNAATTLNAGYTGTISNYYDFRSTFNPTANVTNLYGVYVQGSTKRNYFEGKVGIGVVPADGTSATPSLEVRSSGAGNTVLRLGIERAWDFVQENTGANSNLIFRPTFGGKDFKIMGANNDVMINFDTDNTLAFNKITMVTDGGAVGIGTTTPSSTLQTNGTFALSTATTGVNSSVILLATGTFTPPAANTVSGRMYIIRNTATAANVIVSNIIDFAAATAANFILTPTIGSVMIISDGTNWYRIQ
ncbi:hypothetical protein ACFOWM_12180 [Ferruginibacter yonginensis]|uniref:Uncharacterized protein n=1 Tax=Ferruginibacter yonginensis TaxID=1310416 RepID=A0ABV8QUT2_9BACT